MGSPKRLILIDQSLVKVGGHHYEYARHVLGSAKAAGYETVLVANRRCRIPEVQEHVVLPLYRFSFWGEEDRRSLLQRLVEAGARVRVSLVRARQRFLNSWLGYAAILVREGRFGELLNYFLYKDIRRHLLLPAAALAVMSPLLAVLAVLWAVVWRRLGVGRLVGGLLGRAAMLVAWLLRSVRPGGGLFRLRRRVLVRRAFGKDTARMVDKLKPRQGDIVFIPTISHEELEGLADYLDGRDGPGCSWALLFRRNIFTLRAAEYGSELESVRELAVLFKSLTLGRHAERLFFFTDTDELSAQYERIAEARFEPLPIPHTYAAQARQERRGPMLVTYLGDARTEKGYQHLPEVVADILSRGDGGDRFRFVFQSNFNVSGGEPAVLVARGRLELWSGRGVALLKEPLGSDEYEALVRRGDATLLLYDRTNYNARSSGIVIESLAAGTPVIVPGGTWLSRQILENTIGHYESLVRHAEARVPLAVRWFREGNPLVQLHEGFSVAGEARAVGRAAVPQGQYGYAVLRLLLGDVEEDTCLSLRVEETARPYRRTVRSMLLEYCSRRQEAWALIPLRNDTVSLRLVLSRAFTRRALFVKAAGVTLATFSPVGATPLGAVGLAYNEVGEVPALLREIEAHLDHYQHSALAAAKQLLAWHNADQLVAGLEVHCAGGGHDE